MVRESQAAMGRTPLSYSGGLSREGTRALVPMCLCENCTHSRARDPQTRLWGDCVLFCSLSNCTDLHLSNFFFFR
jgi:hypothetical protein